MRFLRRQEVERLLGVGKSTVYDLVHRGELRAIRVGTGIRIEERSVIEYIESHRLPSDDPARPRSADEILAELRRPGVTKSIDESV